MAQLAEKSRDEAIAELNKALETLGQLRIDLRKAEKERDNALYMMEEWKTNAEADEREAKRQEVRAQSAEASLAKLRKAAKEVSEAWKRPDGSIAAAIAALRSLLDEPDKDQNNAKR